MIVCKSPDEIGRLRAANHLVADVLCQLQVMVAPGVTTHDLDAVAEASIRDVGAVPAFKGYQGYPATLCASVNDAVVHGIPSDDALKDGDIISIDLGVVLDGYYGDSALTVGVGQVSDQASSLMTVTREALERAIAKVQVEGTGVGSWSCRPAACRGAWVFGGQGVCRSRDWDPASRGAPDTELRRTRPGTTVGEKGWSWRSSRW